MPIPTADAQENPARKVMVRIPYYLSAWADGVAQTLDAADVPDVNLDKRRADQWVSKSNLIEQALRDYLTAHDPTGELSTFGER